MWERMAGQMMGAVMGQAQQQAYPTYLYSSAGTTTTSHDLYIGSNTEVNGNTCLGYKAMKSVGEKPVEPPDEFTQLSNHKFHELLDRFSEVT